MKLRDLKTKTGDELKKVLSEYCQKKQQLTFKVANKQLKNIRELRLVKRTIARIKTIQNNLSIGK
ncbi:50S ribosomal protein L29 [Candidatus Falkowbacteria bacterium]|nr:50S ribosomal protein L29 [Candidatus Falkowbacteria bacterium]